MLWTFQPCVTACEHECVRTLARCEARIGTDHPPDSACSNLCGQAVDAEMGQGDRETVQIHTEGGRALARALRTNTSLCCVNLRLNRLGDEGGRAVVDAVRHHPRLERLDLSHNGLAALSAKALGKCLPLNGILREVELLGNSLGAEGGALVRGALEAAPALEVCSLGCCGLADSDLQAVQVCLGACSMAGLECVGFLCDKAEYIREHGALQSDPT